MREAHSFMTKDLLSSETMTYINNLKRQIFEICERYNLHTQADLDALVNREDVDLATIKKLRRLVEQLKLATETNETPEIDKIIEKIRRIAPEYQAFVEVTIHALENEHTPWYENLGRIRAIAKAGEPKMAWGMYQELHKGVPDELFASPEHDLPTLIAIFHASAEGNIETISHRELLRKLNVWKLTEDKDTSLYDQSFFDFFLAAAGAHREEDRALQVIYPHLSKRSQMHALFWGTGRRNFQDPFVLERRNFESKLDREPPEIHIEFYSRWFAQNHYQDPEDLDCIKFIEETYEESRLLFDPAEVILATAAAYARMGFVDKAFEVIKKECLNPLSGSETYVTLAAAFLEGPHVDVANAKRALNECTEANWRNADGDAVLEIVPQLILAQEGDFAKQFVQNYCTRVKNQSVRLLLQTVNIFTDAGLDAKWAVDLLVLFGTLPTVATQTAITFSLREAQTAQHFRAFKRDVGLVRKLESSKLNELIQQNQSDQEILGGMALSATSSELVNIVNHKRFNDPDAGQALMERRFDLEQTFGKGPLDSLVYGQPFE